MSLPRPAAVLFDLDGTLVDTAPDFFGVVNQLRQQAGLSALDDQRIREQVSNGGTALTSLTWEISPEADGFAAKRQLLLDCYEQYIGSRCQLFQGFESLLARLNNSNIAWGIVTNKPRRYTELLLQRMPLTSPVVVCPEDVNHAKPHPEPLLLAAQQLQLEPAHCWYIGDHQRDIDAGRAAGMPTLGCRFGYVSDPTEADQWQADAVLDQPQDLQRLLSHYL
ncbi:phosphoglycolate phosphatase [Bacterioplanes sanyensis]|uniref:Phosphoglycolate phosphatase n=1 Tax=Bacterioplanes sanyensis TaxID=1249553 RepID=A0A222FMY7_9GAMM|nr:HAD-IA family hydrolase [Bacterioplanes sanyensis]ASP40397.1 phosphoglycolate phosphatase [Bacterioplanes sanyensis]